MNRPLVSIIVLNYNGRNHLNECFTSLYNINYKNTELILIDNNSTDKSVEFIKEKFKKVKIFKLDRNYGFAQGNNLGLPHTNGKFIVLLNMDTIVDKNWLTELIKVAEQSKKIGIVGGKIYYYDDRKTIDFAGSYTDIYGNIIHIGQKKVGTELYNKQMISFYICGASILFRRELYDKINLFDPFYYMYYEDVDFCWRAWINGYDIIYAPKSIIFHKIKRSANNVKKKYFFTEKNKLRTILKNYELKSLFKILPGYFFLQLRRIFKKKRYIPQLRRFDVLVINIRVIIWNIIHVYSLIRYRKIIQTNRKRNDKFLFNLIFKLEEIVKKI